MSDRGRFEHEDYGEDGVCANCWWCGENVEPAAEVGSDIELCGWCGHPKSIVEAVSSIGRAMFERWHGKVPD